MSKEILNLPMQENDAGAATIGDYLKKLLLTVWIEGEGFSGKRLFGNSCWEFEIYEALGKNGYIKAVWNEWNELEEVEDDKANQIIKDTIEELFNESM